MDVIPVLDVRGGVAVRADGGERGRYAPLRSVLARGSGARALADAGRAAPVLVGADPMEPVPGDADPAGLARGCREGLGTLQLYVADLDAIEGTVGEPGRLDRAAALVARLASEGSVVWLDAGCREVGEAEALLEAGACRVVVGLETLPSLERLRDLARACGRDRLAFSLDVRDGRSAARDPALAGFPPETIAVAAAEAGFGALVVLDLSRVGCGVGPPLALVRRLHGRLGGSSLVAGGGVRGVEDLRALADAGCAACLVGTALHRGVLGRADVEALRARASPLSPAARASPGRSPTAPPTPPPRPPSP